MSTIMAVTRELNRFRPTGVDAHLTEIDGHITLTVNPVPAVHEWLLQHP
jgi:hypothetical protein